MTRTPTPPLTFSYPDGCWVSSGLPELLATLYGNAEALVGELHRCERRAAANARAARRCDTLRLRPRAREHGARAVADYCRVDAAREAISRHYPPAARAQRFA